MGLNVSYQYLDTRTDQASAGAVPNQIDNSVGYSRHKGVAALSYDTSKFDGQVQVSYIGSAYIDPNTTANFYSIPKVKAFTYVNLSLAYKVTDRFTIHADVDNLFDAKAPYPYPASGGTSTYFQGILGTYFRIGAGVHF